MDKLLFAENLNEQIQEIKLFKYNINAKKNFSFGTWTSRQHAFIKISCDNEDAQRNKKNAKNHDGYGENIMSTNNPEINLNEWGRCFSELQGLTVKEALHHVRKNLGIWGERQSEMAEMALVDLAGKILNVPATKLLMLDGTRPIYGVFVILSDDVEDVRQKARWAVENNRNMYIKVKLFGDVELDTKIIKAVREVSGNETFLIGDVNGGYSMKHNSRPVDEIAMDLNILCAAGLDACEDPAYMDNALWVDLQKRVGVLSLLPDYPMRPAWEAINTIKEGMGSIYNIHPGCMGSIFDAISLAKRIQEMGAKLMIGDDSLIGPACTMWQQVAIGLGADWVEAIEKDKESDSYLAAVIEIATVMDKEGKINLNKNTEGFGLKLNEDELCKMAAEVMTI